MQYIHINHIAAIVQVNPLLTSTPIKYWIILCVPVLLSTVTAGKNKRIQLMDHMLIVLKTVTYRVSQKSTLLRLLHMQTKIYPFVRHSYPHLYTNFCPLISIFVRNVTIFVTLTPEFYHFITAFCSIHKLLLKQIHFIKQIIQ